MPLEKNYAVLEIQKVLLDVAVDAKKYPTDEALYLQVAKETYDHLEQIFRLVLEPVFNDQPFEEELTNTSLLDDALAELDLAHKKINGLDKDYKLLEETSHYLRNEFKRLEKEQVDLLNANENMHVNFKEHEANHKEQIAWLRKLIGSALMNRG